MSLVVNSNISSLNAQRQLSQTGASLDKASERLASGARINSAADDAAGLSISNRQTSQIRGLNQAIRNANDGISLIQTAEGALDETTNILQRMRELAIQSSNEIYSPADRATMDAEVQQLKAEIDRIASSTSFNGQNLLDGTLGELSLQVGAMANQTISVEVGKLDSKGLGGAATGDVVGSDTTLAALQAVDQSDGDNTVTINGQAVGDLSDADTVQDALKIMNGNVSGVEVSAFVEMTADDKGNGVIRGEDTVTVTVLKQDGSTSSYGIRDTGSMQEFVDKLNKAAGGDLKASLNDEGHLMLNSDTAASITVTEAGVDAEEAIGIATTTAQSFQLSFEITDSSVKHVDIALGDDLNDGSLGLNAREDSNITGTAVAAKADFAEGDITINGVKIDGFEGDAAAPATATAIAEAVNKQSSEHGVFATVAGGALTLNSVSGKEIKLEFADDAVRTAVGLLDTNSAASTGNSVSDLDVSTTASAQKAVDTLDAALEQINSTRADLGAVNNRLDFTVSNLANVAENTAAARSRIMDTDFAAETAELSRSQVLQQASQAMLAQANARPQQVLSLLQ